MKEAVKPSVQKAVVQESFLLFMKFVTFYLPPSHLQLVTTWLMRSIGDPNCTSLRFAPPKEEKRHPKILPQDLEIVRVFEMKMRKSCSSLQITRSGDSL